MNDIAIKVKVIIKNCCGKSLLVFMNGGNKAVKNKIAFGFVIAIKNPSLKIFTLLLFWFLFDDPFFSLSTLGCSAKKLALERHSLIPK